MTHGHIHPAQLTSGEFIAQAAAAHAAGPERALAIYRNALRRRHCDEPWVALPRHPVVRVEREGGTTKFVLRHPDGRETESVILPIAGSTGRLRHTLCVSSQVGCAMGCRFCETAQMGLLKNLSPEDIVAQWLAGRFELSAPVDNIVFMGMGEPMDNLDAVIQSIAVLSDRNGAAIAPSRISVSTAGLAAGIVRLAAVARTPGFRKLRLAVSLNAPNDQIRSHIMPINRATPMAELLEAMLCWPAETTGGAPRQRVFIEYVLIPGVNDALQHADELCRYLRPLRCTLNVIPYNPRRDSPWPAPHEHGVSAFIQRARENGQFVKRRRTMGRSVMAACGQLGNPAIRGRKLVQLALRPS